MTLTFSVTNVCAGGAHATLNYFINGGAANPIPINVNDVRGIQLNKPERDDLILKVLKAVIHDAGDPNLATIKSQLATTTFTLVLGS